MDEHKIIFTAPRDGSSIFLYSKDGEEWTVDGKTSLGGNVKGNQLVYVHSKHPGKKVVLYSTDGIIWKRLSPSSGTPYKSVSAPRTAATEDNVVIQLNGPTYRIRLPENSGNQFTLQASTDLQHWVDLTILTNIGSILNFVDPEAIKYPQRFYRLKLTLNSN